jgi:hypothetical protein
MPRYPTRDGPQRYPGRRPYPRNAAPAGYPDSDMQRTGQYDRPLPMGGPPGRRRLPPRPPFTKGTYIGLIGKIIYLIALFLPWYSLMVLVESGDYATHGWVELVHIDGIRGIQISELLTGGHIPKSITNLPVPFMLLAFFVWSIISLFRARTARARGWKFFSGGLVILIIFIILYVLVSKLPLFIPEDSPNALKHILDYIVAYPLGGTAKQDFGDYGRVQLQWGLQAGGFMLLASAIIQLIGGVMEWTSKVK